MSFEDLKRTVVENSIANDYIVAKNEWFLSDIYYDEEWDKCSCGHDIKEVCWIQNTNNGNRLKVGNSCIKQFIGIDMTGVFNGLKRIIDSYGNTAANAALIDYASDKNIINSWEESFLTSTKNKRILSSKQYLNRVKINKKIITRILFTNR